MTGKNSALSAIAAGSASIAADVAIANGHSYAASALTGIGINLITSAASSSHPLNRQNLIAGVSATFAAKAMFAFINGTIEGNVPKALIGGIAFLGGSTVMTGSMRESLSGRSKSQYRKSRAQSITPDSSTTTSREASSSPKPHSRLATASPSPEEEKRLALAPLAAATSSGTIKNPPARGNFRNRRAQEGAFDQGY